ncbi:MAG TPA: type II secretion system protein GspC, partial [Psychromonas hadalis]|nr:type II secretion system protein GspC [Psychromonas hadalis]
YQVAVLSWSALPSDNANPVWIKPNVTASHGKAANNDHSSELMFGKADQGTVQAAPETHNAPVTKLNLSLVGIVASSDPKYSSAIILYQGKQDTYFIDSKIGTTNATVLHIYPDRLILDLQGALQTLMLDGDDYNAPKTPQRRRQVPAPTRSKAHTVKLNRAEILKNPAKLTHYIRISPVREDGLIKGYRLRPGRDPSVFNDAGLKAGDIAVELNGTDLTNMAEAMTLMKAFPTMTSISVNVLRNGQVHELFLNVPE